MRDALLLKRKARQFVPFDVIRLAGPGDRE
jgi:hypothetical protein